MELEDLPDDILLLICQQIYYNSRGQRDKICHVSLFGSVSSRMRQIERIFWRRIVSSKNTKDRPLKIPKNVKVCSPHRYALVNIFLRTTLNTSTFTNTSRAITAEKRATTPASNATIIFAKSVPRILHTSA